MRKIAFFVLVVSLFITCKNATNSNTTEEVNVEQIATKNWPKKLNIHAKATAILEEWPEFNALDTSIDDLYTAEGYEDMVLVVDELIEKQKLLAKSAYPENYNNPQIKSRQKIVQTYILKTKGDLTYKLPADTSIVQLLTAYNAMRKQFMVVVNNPLNNDLLLEEQ